MPPIFLEILPDGTEVIYLTRAFEPATKDDFQMVKVVYPDGRVVFGYPVAKEKPAP